MDVILSKRVCKVKKGRKDRLMKNGVSRKVAMYGLMICLAMILGYVESLIPIPIPVPGVKLGLANIVTVTGLYLTGIPGTVLITILRIVLIGLSFANPYSMLYGLSGSTFSLIVMSLMKKTGKFSCIGVSIAGGIAHNIGQITFAAFVMETAALYYYLPVLIVAGCIAGLVIGILGGILVERLSAFLKNQN